MCPATSKGYSIVQQLTTDLPCFHSYPIYSLHTDHKVWLLSPKISYAWWQCTRGAFFTSPGVYTQLHPSWDNHLSVGSSHAKNTNTKPCLENFVTFVLKLVTSNKKHGFGCCGSQSNESSLSVICARAFRWCSSLNVKHHQMLPRFL